MSTHTKIQTSIRDLSILMRLLAGADGVTVRDLGNGGVEASFPRHAVLPSGLAIRAGQRLTFTRRADGGHDIDVYDYFSESLDAARRVRAVLDAHESRQGEEDNRRAREAEERIRRLTDSAPENGRPESELPPVAAPAAADEEERRISAREESDAILRRMEEDARRLEGAGDAGGEAPESEPGKGGDGPPPAGEADALVGGLAQCYAREVVLEQLAEIEARYGVRLSGERRLADGTVELTLWG